MSLDLDATDLLRGFDTFTRSGEGHTPSQDRPNRLAVVDPTYVGGRLARVTFEGESLLTAKEYPALVDVRASQRVLLTPVGRGYVIAGPVGATTDPRGLVRRTGTALTGAAGAYANISANAAWDIAGGVFAGGMTYANGFVVPTGGAGEYEVEWTLLMSTTAGGLAGIQRGGGAVSGASLHALGPIYNGGAAAGGCSARVQAADADVFTLHLYGATALTVQAVTGGIHWGVRRIGP